MPYAASIRCPTEIGAIALCADSEKSLNVTFILPSGAVQAMTCHGDQGLCFASRTGDTNLVTGFVDAELNLVWTRERAVSNYEFPAEIMSVVGANNAC